jgi:dethiobiotin synthetase
MSLPSVFITATGTDVGKTTISKWLCYHLGYTYFKPIQTGKELDRETVETFTKKKALDSIYQLNAPLSPNQAALLEGVTLDLSAIRCPENNNLLVEGAGGVMVPINESCFMIDLIKKFELPVILVSSSNLGTLNHTLLTLAALRSYEIEILGIILNGPKNERNKIDLETFGKVRVLDELEFMDDEILKRLNPSELLLIKLGEYERERV